MAFIKSKKKCCKAETLTKKWSTYNEILINVENPDVSDFRKNQMLYTNMWKTSKKKQFLERIKILKVKFFFVLKFSQESFVNHSEKW